MKKHTRPPYERMLWLDRQLREQRYPNSTDMVDKFEIKERTFFRDLAFFRDRLLAPVEYDHRRRGYYYTDPGFVLPAVTISQGELFSVLIAEKALHAYSGTPFEAELRAAFEKIIETLPESVQVDFAGQEAGLSFDLGPLRQSDPETFQTLCDAIQQRRRVHLRYHTLSREADTEREVDPYRLHNDRGDWYLLGHCHLRGEVRKFLLGRILAVRTLSHTFPPPDFDLDAYLQESFGILTGRERTEVVLRFDPAAAKYIRERQWHETQQLKDLPDGRLELTMTVRGIDEVRRWLLQYAGEVEVVKPQALRQTVARLAAETARRNAD